MNQSAANCSDIVARRIVSVLSLHPSGLITDIDGTLSPIAPTPDLAEVSSRVRSSLTALSCVVDSLAAVTGRSSVDARRLVGIPKLLYIGNHGLEALGLDGYWAHPHAKRWQPNLTSILQSLAPLAEKLGGVFIEDKGLTASVHYRLNSSPAETRSRLLAAIKSLAVAADAIITEGKMVIEVRPPVDVTKGTAILDLVHQTNLRGVVFLGDDLTDLDAFRSIRRWTDETGGQALTIAVVGDGTPQEVCDNSDIHLCGVTAVEELLDSLVGLMVSR